MLLQNNYILKLTCNQCRVRNTRSRSKLIFRPLCLFRMYKGMLDIKLKYSLFLLIFHQKLCLFHNFSSKSVIKHVFGVTNTDDRAWRGSQNPHDDSKHSMPFFVFLSNRIRQEMYIRVVFSTGYSSRLEVQLSASKT